MKKVFILFSLSLVLFAKNPIAIIQTPKGNIEIELRPDIAPKAVENFIRLSKKGYYDNTTFHRIIKNFMIQGGDPTGTGKGGQSIWGKPFKDEFKPGVLFDKAGILAMANRGKNTNSSQFFITVAPAYWLNGYYTIFGYVKPSSMKIVKEINNVKTNGKQGGFKPLKKQKVLKIVIK